MTEITYLRGDATCPQAKGPKIICHICNDIGGWGKGFVLALSKRWKQPESGIEPGMQSDEFAVLPGSGAVCSVESTIWVANMIGSTDSRPGAPDHPSVMTPCANVC